MTCLLDLSILSTAPAWLQDATMSCLLLHQLLATLTYACQGHGLNQHTLADMIVMQLPMPHGHTDMPVKSRL